MTGTDLFQSLIHNTQLLVLLLSSVFSKPRMHPRPGRTSHKKTERMIVSFDRTRFSSDGEIGDSIFVSNSRVNQRICYDKDQRRHHDTLVPWEVMDIETRTISISFRYSVLMYGTSGIVLSTLGSRWSRYHSFSFISFRKPKRIGIVLGVCRAKNNGKESIHSFDVLDSTISLETQLSKTHCQQYDSERKKKSWHQCHPLKILLRWKRMPSISR